MTSVRILACARGALDTQEVQAVALPKDREGKPRQALLLRGSDGEPRAYLNRCRHLPIPIDCGSGSYLTQDKAHLLCGTHGALYRRDDGMCIAGPCRHLALEKLQILEENGMLYVLL